MLLTIDKLHVNAILERQVRIEEEAKYFEVWAKCEYVLILVGDILHQGCHLHKAC